MVSKDMVFPEQDKIKTHTQKPHTCTHSPEVLKCLRLDSKPMEVSVRDPGCDD